MKRIIKIGADVHSTNYTLCAVEPLLEGDVNELFTMDVEPRYQEILRFIEKLRKRFPSDELSITCGYEAGCLGYRLFHDLEANGVKCVIWHRLQWKSPAANESRQTNGGACHHRGEVTVNFKGE